MGSPPRPVRRCIRQRRIRRQRAQEIEGREDSVQHPCLAHEHSMDAVREHDVRDLVGSRARGDRHDVAVHRVGDGAARWARRELVAEEIDRRDAAADDTRLVDDRNPVEPMLREQATRFHERSLRSHGDRDGPQQITSTHGSALEQLASHRLRTACAVPARCL